MIVTMLHCYNHEYKLSITIETPRSLGMSPIIRISEPVYDRLQSIAVPFIDTPASVIERLIDLYEVNSNIVPSSYAEKRENIQNRDIMTFDPENPPNLIHTRIIEAQFGEMDATNWNDLVHAAHRLGKKNAGSIKNLEKISTSKIMDGCYTERGHVYYKDIDMSIQSTNSNDAWKNTLNLAQKLNVNVRAIFIWRRNKGASNPGEKGMLEWNPKGTP